jgi:TRAP-type uncharacterized transport system substrate-binding protein
MIPAISILRGVPGLSPDVAVRFEQKHQLRNRGWADAEALLLVGRCFILTRDDLPDDTAYTLARTLHGAEAALCARLPQACETTAANTVAAALRPELIHPGVMRYFREIGVVK